jgi:hypothetical protein
MKIITKTLVQYSTFRRWYNGRLRPETLTKLGAVRAEYVSMDLQTPSNDILNVEKAKF